MPSDISDPTKPNIPVDPKTYVDNGYSVKAGTMLGASLYGYSRGMRAIHETGHWLGNFMSSSGTLATAMAISSVARHGRLSAWMGIP
jgi:hypothetical protein